MSEVFMCGCTANLPARSFHFCSREHEDKWRHRSRPQAETIKEFASKLAASEAQLEVMKRAEDGWSADLKASEARCAALERECESLAKANHERASESQAVRDSIDLRHVAETLRTENTRLLADCAAMRSALEYAYDHIRSGSWPSDNAPGHAHSVSGVWDPDNISSGLAGKTCTWCTVEWPAVLAALQPNPGAPILEALGRAAFALRDAVKQLESSGYAYDHPGLNQANEALAAIEALGVK